MLRRTLITACSLFFLAATGLVAKDEGFEGKWKLDKNGSVAKGAPGALEEEIKMKNNTITIKSQFDQPRDGVYPLMWVGIMTQELSLNSDGSQTINHIGPFQHVSKTTVMGGTMKTEWTANIENGNVTGEWVRTLSPDGKQMTLQIKGRSSDGRTIDETLTFKRK